MIVSLVSGTGIEHATELVEPLVRVFQHRNASLIYLNILLDEEIKNATTTTLFRGNSFCTASIVLFMKVAFPFLLFPSLERGLILLVDRQEIFNQKSRWHNSIHSQSRKENKL